LRPKAGVERLALSWVGINAVEIEGRLTQPARIVGLGNGRAGQEIELGVTSVDPDALDVQVEDETGVFRRWTRTDDLLTAGRDEWRYELDPEAGVLRFGDGMRGARPTEGGRVRVDGVRSGGGTAWNLSAGTLTAIEAVDLDRRPVTGLKVLQPLATTGGEDVETLEAAERRIPARLRHGDRAVTTDDYRELAAATPGVRLGRVEVLPRFRPHQHRSGVPGVVSVMILPRAEGVTPPNPRADRPTIERVFAYLDERRPLGTELYVIGVAYVPVAVSAGVTLRDGVDRDVARREIALAIRRFLWPLAPGGADETGWPLGRTVTDRSVEVIVARVPQVREVRGITLFRREGEVWRARTPEGGNGPASVTLEGWELPELLQVAVAVDADPPLDPTAGEPDPFATPNGVGVPVLPEVC
jgi:predicted phage baseplate assembly protein